jgi:transposase
MPEEIVGRVLRLVGYKAYRWDFQEEASNLTIWVRQAASRPFYTCSGCGVGTERVHSVRERRVRDLPWGAWKVTLALEVHRVYCRRCGVRGERIEFLEGKHPYTARFAAAVARDCEDAAVRRVAAKWSLSAQTVRRIDKRSLRAWAEGRRRRPLRWMGVDEIFWGKGKCLTVVSDLAAGEPIWGGPERRKATLDRFFAEYLPPRRRRAVKAVCVDMWRPFLESLREHLPKAAVVFDKFHVMKHVNAAIDETRREEFFRQSPHLRAAMRGKRWLLLTRWHNLSRPKRTQLKAALALNRRLFKAYYLKEQIERLWSYSYEGAAIRFLDEWVKSLRWQRLPAFQKLALTLLEHLEGLLAYCKHKVPFGVVEAINGNLRSLIRRGRGYQDHEYLILKAQRSTAQARLAQAA